MGNARAAEFNKGKGHQEKDRSLFMKDNEKAGLVTCHLGQTTDQWKRGEAKQLTSLRSASVLAQSGGAAMTVPGGLVHVSVSAIAGCG